MVRFRILLLAGLTVPVLALDAPADEATEAFDSLYGNDMKAVAATPDTADDLALAAKLLEAAGATTTHPALAVVLCDNAYNLATKDPKGATTAVQAMDLAARKAPEKQLAFLAKAVAVRQGQYDAASGTGQTGAGNDLIGALLQLGSALADARDADAAEKTYQRALLVANAIKTPLADVVQEHLDGLAARRKTAIQIKVLKEAVEADPANTSARSALVRLYTIEMDDPAEAAKYLDESSDATFRKYVPAAAKGVSKAPELACMDLGEWYRGLASESTSAARKALLKRAQAYYERFLQLHETDDLSRSQAVLALSKVNDALAGPAAAVGAAAAAKGEKLPNATWVDLLKLIDPAKDCIDAQGLAAWKRRGNALVATPLPHGRTTLFAPVSANGNYDLQVKFVRSRIDGSIYVHLPVGSNAVSLRLYSGTSGLSYINGQSAYSNGTGVFTSFQMNRVYTVDVKVTLDQDQAAIAVNLDDKPLVRWKGAQADLSPSMSLYKDRIGFAVYETATTFGTALLRMQSGTATALRS